MASHGLSWADIRFLPVGTLFTPLLADPKETRFSTHMVYTRYPPRDARGASVSAGGEIGLFREESSLSETRWQLGISGGAFGEFDLDSPSSDLVNVDYSV